MVEVLDWSNRRHWNGGKRPPCRVCGEKTFLLDAEGRPCHKSCAENELTEEIQRVTKRARRRRG